METNLAPTVWNELNPVWMFRCRPADFRCCGHSICHGIFWLPGVVALLVLHVASCQGFWLLWQAIGRWACLSLLPVSILWVWFAAADVKFRWQRPTREERWGFDNAVVNWFGFGGSLVFSPVILPAGLIALL